ncbi:unnamed protein product, partial [Onchocerca flexuosa]|uniref:RRM domain-containing protein n=1 Tax=Onchocerca flexuosa TaxID=387005 RepID=A0A183I3U4_9BILA
MLMRIILRRIAYTYLVYNHEFMMDFRSEVRTFARPVCSKSYETNSTLIVTAYSDLNAPRFLSSASLISTAMFKTLRRLHGYNLENRGLNDLSEKFQNFVTRARFFNIGRLRRTWSHSAIEFLKYRRLLPMLVSDKQRDSSYQRSKNDDRKILVTNISCRVTANQLISFFSKFGPIASCYIPSEERQYSLYATLPKKSRSNLTAFIIFKSMEGAERAKNATADDLRFYDQVMLISQIFTVMFLKSQQLST